MNCVQFTQSNGLHVPVASLKTLPTLASFSKPCRPQQTGPLRLRERQSTVECSAAASSAFPAPPQEREREPAPAAPAPGTWVRFAALAAGAAICFSIVASAPSTGSSAALAAVSLSARSFTAETIATAVKSACAGLAAGCLHTLAGADHLAALTPLTIGRSQLKASLLGALWGFGHSTGQLILGLLMVILKDRFTALVPALSKWGGTTVGLTLLAIGAMGIYESFFEEHDDKDHAEAATASASVSSVADAFTSGVEVQTGGLLAVKEERRGFGLATFATGIVYGLQPDALFVIVPALALPTKLAAVAYILMFVVGTVAAMGAYTGIIGATSAAIKRSNSGLTKKLSGIAAFAAIAIGLGVLASGWGVDLPWFGGGHHH
ncbi:hypothetical protein Ndes2526B_g00453 [Nannochloris sp. 'desiccata']|nr:hypothetical protein KSW81_003224 [Chlorella desiccata (nom. nud.)]KAH7625072.1 hypothetical protein NADE_002290 [Chlorella desiccata (nom. nud.)]